MSCGEPHETDCREVLDRVYRYLDSVTPPQVVNRSTSLMFWTVFWEWKHVTEKGLK